MAAEYARPRAEFSELVEVMARLRDECPWDRSQTHRSLVTYLVEETGEVIDAIEAGTDDDLVEELGICYSKSSSIPGSVSRGTFRHQRGRRWNRRQACGPSPLCVLR